MNAEICAFSFQDWSIFPSVASPFTLVPSASNWLWRKHVSASRSALRNSFWLHLPSVKTALLILRLPSSPLPADPSLPPPLPPTTSKIPHLLHPKSLKMNPPSTWFPPSHHTSFLPSSPPSPLYGDQPVRINKRKNKTCVAFRTNNDRHMWGGKTFTSALLWFWPGKREREREDG